MADIEYEIGSGNVFADICCDEPDEALVKAELARRVGSIIQHRHLTQAQAATLLNVDQPKISKLLRGQLQDFSLERLIKFLLLLDRDVEIVIKKTKTTGSDTEARRHGRLAVCVA